MDRDDEDFASQMHLLVLEQGHLFEFPAGGRDLLPSGTVHHGPWDPLECAEVLASWFAEGWLTLVVDAIRPQGLAEAPWWSRTTFDADPRFRNLALRDAAALLRSPTAWLPGTPDGQVMLSASDSGDEVASSDWLAAAERSLRGMHRRVPRFYRRAWDESRGDQYDTWGTCVYYFWALDGTVEKQVQRYANGNVLAYDRLHREDEYGFLTTEPLHPASEWEPFRIDLATFQCEVELGPRGALNRR